ncbi:aminodeoxychorismate lyase [Iodobacter fluviatilis]|uniref:aminodeoxychorismate lyase n=1 Tax=Iodobacter fluviatilis TaxID=537 RepID=A0A377SY83_9NEIS|nr:aminodeoxychorismate lyase [Iodobacter fluviatilis]TCU85040.1 4-amino-4-deoxychorismate lyase [Iodobacter fluviatilis]STR45276.1 Aminodeoxychorismate lyase [Iodobacter fluviatilis]
MRLLNGQPQDVISMADRAFQFGDGVFRTMRCIGGSIEFWARHYARLQQDCAALGIMCPAEDLLLEDFRKLTPIDAVLKIIITRGETSRGYGSPPALVVNRIVQVAALPVYPDDFYQQGVKVRVCTTRASWQPALAGVKHLNRIENVLARREWSDPDIFEGLMLDRDDQIVEGVMSNVLVLSDSILSTPKLDQSGVNGVMREAVFDAAMQHGWTVEKRVWKLDEIKKAEAIWLTNSVMGLLPVSSLCEQHFAPHPAQVLLSAALKQLRQKEKFAIVNEPDMTKG